MSLISQAKARLPQLMRLGSSLLLGAGVSFFLSSKAEAAETITLRFEDAQVTVPIAEIENFVSTGTVEGDLQTFFQTRPEIEQVARDLFTEEITVTRAFVERTLNSSTGEFVLIQLEKLLSTPSGQENLVPLRTALLSAYEDDNKFSILEILQNYPDPELDVDLRGLERVYGDVSAFIERVGPALEVAREFLQELVCECDAPTAASGTSSETSSGTSSTASPSEVSPADRVPAETSPSESSSPQSLLPTDLSTDSSKSERQASSPCRSTSALPTDSAAVNAALQNAQAPATNRQSPVVSGTPQAVQRAAF